MYEPFYHPNDIALLRLSKKAKYSEFISLICLTIWNNVSSKDFENEKLIVVGWSSTEKGRESEIKQKAEVFGVNTGRCSRQFQGIVSNKQICAKGDNGVNPCPGDSGGPLMFLDKSNNESSNILVGIVSFGKWKYCAWGVWPVYTKVSKYMGWIRKNIES